MMMRMLEAGGLPLLTDGIRSADEDNPRGYFELERVKELDKGGDKTWLADARGKGVKIISFLLKDLPGAYQYRVIFMRREIREVIASQHKMLIRRGENADESGDARMMELYQGHLKKVDYLTSHAPNFERLDVEYKAALASPAEQAGRIARFIGRGVDAAAMATAIDKNLYRNRS